ncbi:MAG: hypothetical protein ACRCTY_05915 [Candidatus Adiutrix sp.]
MSGDHRGTTLHNISLLTQELELKKIGTSSLFYREDLLVFSPAVKENSKRYYWFDIREANIDKMLARSPEKCMLLVRIVPDKFILCPFDQIEPLLVSPKKAHAGKKAWEFRIENEFTVIRNWKSKDKTQVKLIAKERIIGLLGKMVS